MGKFECHCGMDLTDGTELTQCINTTHTWGGGGGWACSFLGCTSSTVYKTSSSVRKHFRITHKNLFHYQCKLCLFGHEEETSMKKHIEKQYKISGLALKCGRCGRPFGQKNKFESHILICGNDVRPSTCSELGCPKAYRSKWMFDDHMRTIHPGLIKTL